MINFKNRVPTIPNRKKVTFEDTGEVRYAVIEFADEPTETGTPINRDNMLAIQGLVESVTTFNPDGSISTTYSDNSVNTFIFNSDGTINENFTNNTQTIIKKTTFNTDGTIKEEIL